MKTLLRLLPILLVLQGKAQHLPDEVYVPNIKSVKLFQQNNQESLPLLRLNSGDQLELHFDDLDNYVKNYYYTFQLCNADWQPADISSFDYIRGFTQMRLTEYRASSLSLTRYIHYQAMLPENNCVPTKSGNYLLRVYLDGDTAQTVFTKRMYVVENRVATIAQIQQPFDNQLFHTHQKIQLSINQGQLNMYNPQQQMKIVVLQNNRWDNAVTNIVPSFIRGNVLEYNGEEDITFPGGREYRWADLRSFRFQSDRVAGVDINVLPYEVILKPDPVRRAQPYITMRDLNGWYEISASESINPWWQSDYANVHFSFAPDNHQPFADKDVYLVGELTGNNTTPAARMEYNAAKGIYEKTLLLKQGYYAYAYMAKDRTTGAKADPTLTEGSFWETENDYVVLVYYRSINDRSDELVAVSQLNTRAGRPLQ